MIRKLQRKFIMITMLSLTLVMLLLVGTINAINFYQTNNRINGAIKILSDNHGQFPKFDKGMKPERKPRSDFQMNEETPFETRYFIVDVSLDGSINQLDTSHIAVSASQAVVYAKTVIDEKKDKSGFIGVYKYAVVDQNDGSMLIFINCRNQLQTITRLFIITSTVALATLLLVFILVSVFSKKAIKPIIESMEKQKQFITDAGHEIKTPLAIISANADVLELTGGENEWINSIRNQTTRLDKLVKNLLALSKMDEGNLNLVFSEFDLSKAVFEITDPFKTIAEMQNKNLIIDIQPELKLHGDVSSIHQLVSTLVDNALKYSNDQGEIKIKLASMKKGIKLEIYNTVDNIDVDHLDKLFDRFYRADSSRSRDTGGYGIGLSIARSIVEAHHGKISAHSEDGKSICFSVMI